MLVMKFGGTSVGSAERYRQVAELVGRYRDQQPVVVVSAMAGTTDWLLATARAMASSTRVNDEAAEQTLVAFRERYHTVIEEAIKSPQIRAVTQSRIAALFRQMLRVFTGIELLGEVSPRSLDAVAAFGEKLSIHLLTGVMLDLGISAEAVSAETLVVTDSTFTAAAPDMDETERRCQTKLLPLVQLGVIPVITGFIGATPDGITTTLGRNGSDYSAGIIGSALNADQIWIWKEVDGVMTADPRMVPHARSLPRISYAEAGELSYFGAKVIHPRTVLPAVEKNIPIYIKNTFNPEFEGTRIDSVGAPDSGVVKAITSARNMSVVTINGSGGMQFAGLACRTFGLLDSLNANVYMVTHASSSQDLCFVVDRKVAAAVMDGLRAAFERELARHEILSIDLLDDVAIIAVVGSGMRGVPGMAGRVFSTLGRKHTNIIAIAQGSTELNISCIVSATDEKSAVAAIHDEFVALVPA